MTGGEVFTAFGDVIIKIMAAEKIAASTRTIRTAVRKNFAFRFMGISFHLVRSEYHGYGGSVIRLGFKHKRCAVRIGDLLTESKTETGSAVFAISGFISSVEWLADV